MILAFNIIVLLTYLVTIIFSRWETIYIEKELKEKGCAEKGNKVVPCLLWGDDKISYCSFKDWQRFEVGKTYTLVVSKRVFFDFKLKK